MKKIKLIEEHLLSGQAITGLTALRAFGYYRLSDGILKLRKKYDIQTDMIKNGKTRYASYKLIKS